MKLAMVAAKLHAGRGERPAPRHGDLPPYRHHPQLSRRRWSSAWSRAAMSATSPSAASSRSRASASMAFPKAMPPRFARLVYVSAWIKCHHPAAFAAALLNSQPMGFYAPAQIVRDAPSMASRCAPSTSMPAIGTTRWSAATNGALALRLGFRQIDGFREDWAETHRGARAARASTASRRLVAPHAACRAGRYERLADADALPLARPRPARRRSGRCAACRATPPLPLFAAADAAELGQRAGSRRCPPCRSPSMSSPITRRCACR